MSNSIEDEFLTEVETKIKSKPANRKKSINSKKKGNSGELELVHILNERFTGHTFARSVSSGAYTGGMNQHRAATLTEEQKLIFSGDIRVPTDFKYTIEHKFYSKIEFWDLFNKGSDLFKWYEQSQTDADNVGKKPLLIVKINNHKRIAFLKNEDARELSVYGIHIVFNHEDRSCLWLEDLLNLPDEFFFNIDNS